MASRPKIPGNPIPRGGGAGATAMPPNPPAAGGAPPVAGAQGADIDNAHFRLDEHQRQIEQLQEGMKPEHVAAVAHGAVAALHVSMQAETEKLLKAVREDVETDKSVVAAIGKLIEAIDRLI